MRADDVEQRVDVREDGFEALLLARRRLAWAVVGVDEGRPISPLYLPISPYISLAPFSGWKHGWMIPFMSMYKLSTGPAPACSVGTWTN